MLVKFQALMFCVSSMNRLLQPLLMDWIKLRIECNYGMSVNTYISNTVNDDRLIVNTNANLQKQHFVIYCAGYIKA